MTSIVDPGGEAARLIPSDSKGRMLVAADQRDALLNAFEQSGQSAMAFCRQHGLKVSAPWSTRSLRIRRCRRLAIYDLSQFWQSG